MIFTTLFALASALVASAADINVVVGDGNQLVFNPNNVQAQQGDNIIFTFANKNHSVTESTFAAPCTQMPGGVDSGLQAVAPGSTTVPQWNITINKAATALWFFCKQTNPVNHCQSGMVFAVNANAPGKDFSAFQAAAKASGNSTTGATGGATGSAGAGAGAGAAPPAVSGASPSTVPAPGSASGSADPGASASGSGSPSGSTSAPNGSIASRGLNSAGAVSIISLIATVAGFML